MTEQAPRQPTARQQADAAHNLAVIAFDEAARLRRELAGLRAQAQSAITWSSVAFLLAAGALAGTVWVILRINGGRLPVIPFRVPDTVARMFPDGDQA